MRYKMQVLDYTAHIKQTQKKQSQKKKKHAIYLKMYNLLEILYNQTYLLFV